VCHIDSPTPNPAMISVRLLLCWTLLCCITGATLAEPQVAAAATTTTSTQSDEVDLDSLSDAELEAICYNLGFELLNNVDDELTGTKVEFSHKDYVEAARQCLAVKEQM
jgi:hypothetical protein